MKEHNWMKYRRTGDIIELTVKDTFGAKIETYRFDIGDHRKTRKVLELLKSKYGFYPDGSVDRDIDWIHKTE